MSSDVHSLVEQMRDAGKEALDELANNYPAAWSLVAASKAQLDDTCQRLLATVVDNGPGYMHGHGPGCVV